MINEESKENILISDRYASLVSVIEDEGLSKIVPVNRQSMISTEEFMNLLGKVSSFRCPEILPKNCRYFTTIPTSKDKIIVI